jgi:hypothetical protein
MVWAGICHDGRTQLEIVQGILNAVKYRDNIPEIRTFARPGVQRAVSSAVIIRSGGE